MRATSPVGDGVVGVERREHHGALDPRACRAGEVTAEVRLGVPGPGQAVAETGVAVAIDDHRVRSHCKMRASAPGCWHGSCWRSRITSFPDLAPEGGSAVSFALEMAMAPKLSLEVSPALVLFGELLTLPCAAMQSVVERELCANAALERLDAGDCPICRGTWRTRCPVCSVPVRRAGDSRFVEVADRAATEPDTQALLRAVRLETSAADAPIAERLIDSLDEHGLLDRSCAQIAADLGRCRIGRGGRAGRCPPLWAARRRRVQRVGVPAAATGRPRPRRGPGATGPCRDRRSSAGAGDGGTSRR